MDAPTSSLGEPCTPKSRQPKAKSNAKLSSQPTPTRSRKRYDAQRRLEVAETRRNGACARCREKKVRCSPARHKASAGASPQTSTETLSNWSTSPRDDDLTCTNNGNKDREIDASNILGLDGCVQAAKEYLKVAQSHVEEFARFVETWEASQKQSIRSQYVEEDAKVSEADSGTTTSRSPQSSKSSSTIEEDISHFDLHPNRTQAVHNDLSDPEKSTCINEHPDIVFSTSIKSAARHQAMLAPKDRNRPLPPKYDVSETTTPRSPKRQAPRPATKGWKPSLRGENEPWVATAPPKASQLPQRSRPSRPSERGRLIDQQKLPSETSFEDFQYNALDDDFAFYGNAMGSGFNFGACFDQEMPQDLDDPFVSSLMTTEPILTASEFIVAQAPLDCLPTSWEANRDHFQTQFSTSDMCNDSLFDKTCFQTPPTSIVPSVDTTPWSIISQSLAPLTPQGPPYTPIRRSSEQLMGKDMLEEQNKVLNIDWSFEDFE
ncbi:hypothetical protein N431DRAFT_559133 [Stipitochalara longipes BDJ]|nr:hypothetical protein N431DRAFT_559133 [Stipitochalara longipes BDJ]